MSRRKHAAKNRLGFDSLYPKQSRSGEVFSRPAFLLFCRVLREPASMHMPAVTALHRAVGVGIAETQRVGNRFFD